MFSSPPKGRERNHSLPFGNLTINQFAQNQLVNLRFQRVHQPHPAHRVTGFQFLGDARQTADPHENHAKEWRCGTLVSIFSALWPADCRSGRSTILLEPATIYSDGRIASGQFSITRTAWVTDRWVFVLAILCRDSYGPAQALVL